MKKRFFILTISLLLLVGCGKENIPTEKIVSSEKQEEINYDEYIRIGEYKHVTEVPDSNITDEYIDNLLESYLAIYAEVDTEKKKGTIESGQNINLSYSIDINGDNQDYNDANVYIGHEEIAPGIDEWLIGKDTGAIDSIEITYPSDYSDETLAGKKAKISVTVNYIVGEPTYKEIDDNFVKTISNETYNTVDEYRIGMKKSLSDSAKYEGGYYALMEVIGKAEIIKDITPLVNLEYERQKKFFQQFYDAGAKTEDTIYKEYGYETEEDYNNYLKEFAEEYTKTKLVVNKLAKELNISTTPEEVNEFRESLKESYTDNEINALYDDEELEYVKLQENVMMKLYEYQDIETSTEKNNN